MKNKPVVKLSGTDGNAFAIIAKVRRVLIENKMYTEADNYMKEALSGDYDNVIASADKYVEIH